jgi:predicted P-loop ATPase
LPLKGLAHELFGVNDPLYDAYFHCWLIGAVARVMNPGCKFDEALILQGAQGYYKSTFFKVMANGFFSDSMKDPERRDDLLVMSQSWILEWSELERMTAKTYHAVVKDFLSKSEDTFRVPYGKDVQRVPRRSVIVGTTNQSEFLTDPTGNRRFWIIPVAKPIPIDFVKDMRDMIWAAAFTAYFQGESWQLPVDLRQSQAEENQLYEISDVWEQVIKPWLETQEGLEITVYDLLKMLEDKGLPVNYSKPEQMRCADILKRSGWKKVRRTRGTQRLMFWVKG